MKSRALAPEEKTSEMASLEAGPITDRFEVRVTADTHFGWLRTRLSVERTLMSYLRTAVSLIGFGFTIVQFFERLPDLPGSKPAYFPEAPYYLGLGADFLRNPGAHRINLAVPLDDPISVERKFRGSRRNDKRGKANTALRGNNCPPARRRLRAFRRAASLGVAQATEIPKKTAPKSST